MHSDEMLTACLETEAETTKPKLLVLAEAGFRETRGECTAVEWSARKMAV